MDHDSWLRYTLKREGMFVREKQSDILSMSSTCTFLCHRASVNLVL